MHPIVKFVYMFGNFGMFPHQGVPERFVGQAAVPGAWHLDLGTVG